LDELPRCDPSGLGWTDPSYRALRTLRKGADNVRGRSQYRETRHAVALKRYLRTLKTPLILNGSIRRSQFVAILVPIHTLLAHVQYIMHQTIPISNNSLNAWKSTFMALLVQASCQTFISPVLLGNSLVLSNAFILQS
jgi:hypothetical protein